MKLLMIFCSEYLSEPVREALDGLKLNCSAEVPEVLGCNGPYKRMDTPAFPGTANLFFVPVDDERVEEVRGALVALLDHCEEERCLRMIAVEAAPLI